MFPGKSRRCLTSAAARHSRSADGNRHSPSLTYCVLSVPQPWTVIASTVCCVPWTGRTAIGTLRVHQTSHDRQFLLRMFHGQPPSPGNRQYWNGNFHARSTCVAFRGEKRDEDPRYTSARGTPMQMLDKRHFMPNLLRLSWWRQGRVRPLALRIKLLSTPFQVYGPHLTIEIGMRVAPSHGS